MARRGRGRITGIFSTVLIAILSSQVSVDAALWAVGDDSGTWTIPATSNDLNYTVWAAGVNIRYGDQLYFSYSNSTHSVLLVNASSYESCLLIDPIEMFTSGQDTITLATPGVRDYYFICGEPTMCWLQQKLHVTLVGDVPSAPPAPSDVTPPLPSGGPSTLHDVSVPSLASTLPTLISLVVFVLTR